MYLVWSKNSCGLALVVFQWPTQLFTALPPALRRCLCWAGQRKKQHIAFALMIPLVMIVFHILVEHMPWGAFAKEYQP